MIPRRTFAAWPILWAFAPEGWPASLPHGYAFGPFPDRHQLLEALEAEYASQGFALVPDSQGAISVTELSSGAWVVRRFSLQDPPIREMALQKQHKLRAWAFVDRKVVACDCSASGLVAGEKSWRALGAMAWWWPWDLRSARA